MALRSRRIVVGTATALLIIAMSLITPPQAALAAGVLDQQQTSILAVDGGATVGGPSHQKVAQVIRAGVSGDLVAVDLPVECFGASTLTVEVRNVVSANGSFSPGTTVIASIVVAAANLPAKDTANFRSFAPSPTTFAAGDRFSIVLSATGPGALVAGSPSSRAVSCDTGELLEAPSPVAVVGGGLHFDTDTNTWSINWKTEAAWAGTCRELVLRLIDGGEHAATIEFE